jgi:hypothetical protein
MKKKFSIAALLVCSFVVCLAAFADLNGKWTGVLKLDAFELPLTYTFKVDGETVTGACNTEQGDFPISNGKIKGSDFTFTLDVNGTAMAQVGKFYGDSTVITSEFQGMKTRVKLTRAQ